VYVYLSQPVRASAGRSLWRSAGEDDVLGCAVRNDALEKTDGLAQVALARPSPQNSGGPPTLALRSPPAVDPNLVRLGQREDKEEQADLVDLPAAGGW
jgi:hypothetical protein